MGLAGELKSQIILYKMLFNSLLFVGLNLEEKKKEMKIMSNKKQPTLKLKNKFK